MLETLVIILQACKTAREWGIDMRGVSLYRWREYVGILGSISISGEVGEFRVLASIGNGTIDELGDTIVVKGEEVERFPAAHL